MSVGGGVGSGAFPTSLVDETAWLPPSSTTLTDILLPTYRSKVGLAAATQAPLVRLTMKSELRDLITHARHLTFAVHGPRHLKTKTRMRITLTGEARNFDHLMAHHLNGRDVSGEFGVWTEGVSPKLTSDFLREDRVEEARQVAEGRLGEIEGRWRVLVLEPLEAQYKAFEAADGGESGGGGGLSGMFRRKSSTPSKGDGEREAAMAKTKVNYKDLTARAGDLMREARKVHEELEGTLLDAAEKSVQVLPAYKAG